MAHGSSRYCICHDCKRIIAVERFKENPKCDICGKETKTTTKDELCKTYWFGILEDVNCRFGEFMEFNYEKR